MVVLLTRWGALLLRKMEGSVKFELHDIGDAIAALGEAESSGVATAGGDGCIIADQWEDEGD